MKFPEDLLYSETHEWVREEGDRVTLGITDYAQKELKDIVYVELPEIGKEFKKGDSIGVVESVKTVTDIFTPVSGKVTDQNVELKNHPEYINMDPYGKGWIIQMEIYRKEELKELLTAKVYQGLLPKEVE
ncbi:MAG: glycine cleavage system protein GcvH [Thermodesulfobacteriota bacterium]